MNLISIKKVAYPFSNSYINKVGLINQAPTNHFYIHSVSLMNQTSTNKLSRRNGAWPHFLPHFSKESSPYNSLEGNIRSDTDKLLSSCLTQHS